jgi:hypothetical protein
MPAPSTTVRGVKIVHFGGHMKEALSAIAHLLDVEGCEFQEVQPCLQYYTTVHGYQETITFDEWCWQGQVVHAGYSESSNTVYYW